MANARGDQYERDQQYDNGGRRAQRDVTSLDRERDRETDREWFDRRESFQPDENIFSDEDRGSRGERSRGFGDERSGRGGQGGGREQDYRYGENAGYQRGGGRESQQGGSQEWQRGSRETAGNRNRYGRGAQSSAGRESYGNEGYGSNEPYGGREYAGGRDTFGSGRGQQGGSYGSGSNFGNRESGQRETYGGSYEGSAGHRPSWETQSGSPEGSWSPYNDSRQRSLAQQTYGQTYGQGGQERERGQYGMNRSQGYGGQGYGSQGYGSQSGYSQGQDQGQGREEHKSFLRRIAEHIGKGPKGYSRTDERIQEEIHERLAYGYLDASDIEVTVKNGEVVLKGTVHSKSDRRIAEDAIDDVMGVKEVDNRLKVKRPESGASTAQLSATSAARNESEKTDKDESGLRGSSAQTTKRS